MNAMKWSRGRLLVAPLFACLVLSGCKDDDDDTLPLDGGSVVQPDGGIDAGSDLIIKPTPLSANGHDRFHGVAYDAQGNIFAVGITSPGTANTDDSAMVIAKFKPDGALDKSFGAPDGFVVQNVSVGGQNVELARSVLVVKAGPHAGKIVVAGEADHQVSSAGIDGGILSRDTDVVVLRLSATGALDPTFGTGGIARLSLGDAVVVDTVQGDGGVTTSLGGADTVWNIGQTTDGKLVLHGASRATEPYSDGGVLRTDSDYTLVRLTDTGALDPSFASGGILRTDVGEANAGARAATVLADNSVVAAGYTSSSALGKPAQQPVLYKVTSTGARDATFAAGGLPDQNTTPGVWHGFARSDEKNCEAYGAAPQSTGKFVTVGYGPSPDASSLGTDWVFFRFNADGTQDKTFGVNSSGQTFLDPGKFSDNGRAIAILPNDRVLGVGGARPAPAVAPDAGTQPLNVDGMLAVLTAAGVPDTSFAPGGYRLLDWGNSDFLHAAALSPSQKQVAVVGAAGGSHDANATADDDAVLVLWSLP